MLSIPHMIVLFVLVLVVFGPQKLPELARTLGKLMAEFRKASMDFKGAFEEEMRNIERQAVLNERQKAAAAAAAVAVAPAEPATQGTAPGAETPSAGTESDTRPSEAPVIAPVAESVPRSTEEHIEEKSETAAVSTHTQDASHDQQPA
jgi:sec-independent protein translocase protein TatB